MPASGTAIVNGVPGEAAKGEDFENEYLLSNRFAPLVSGYQFSLEAEEWVN